jgi:hypothetical protein
LHAGSPLDLAVQDKATLAAGRLPAMLRVVRMCMEESLRILTADSVQSYVEFLERITAFEVQVKSTASVDVAYVHATERECPPLFVVELKIVDGYLQYSVSPDSFEDEPLSLFDAALTSLTDIPRLDSSLIKKLFLGRQTGLKAVRPEDEAVADFRQRIQNCMRNAVRPLREYISLYDEFVEFINMDLSEFCRSYEETGHTLEVLSRRSHFPPDAVQPCCARFHTLLPHALSDAALVSGFGLRVQGLAWGFRVSNLRSCCWYSVSSRFR